MRFLSEEEAALLAAAGDRIFPAGDGSGSASELGLVEFADRQLAGEWGRGARMYRRPPFAEPGHPGHGWQSALTPAEAVRAALAALGAHARAAHGTGFAGLDGAEQDRLLRALEDAGGGASGLDLFALLRGLVLESVLAHPAHGGNRDGAGWRWLGFPGDPVELGEPHADRWRR